MVNDIMDRYDKLSARHYKLKQKHDELKELNKSILEVHKKIKRKLAREGLFLMASIDPYKALDPSEQQGPLVAKLFSLLEELKEKV